MVERGEVQETDTPDEHLNAVIGTMIYKLPKIYQTILNDEEPSVSDYRSLLNAYYEVLFMVNGYVDITTSMLELPKTKKDAVEQIRLFIKQVQDKGFYQVGNREILFSIMKN